MGRRFALGCLEQGRLGALSSSESETSLSSLLEGSASKSEISATRSRSSPPPRVAGGSARAPCPQACARLELASAVPALVPPGQCHSAAAAASTYASTNASTNASTDASTNASTNATQRSHIKPCTIRRPQRRACTRLSARMPSLHAKQCTIQRPPPSRSHPHPDRGALQRRASRRRPCSGLGSARSVIGRG